MEKRLQFIIIKLLKNKVGAGVIIGKNCGIEIMAW